MSYRLIFLGALTCLLLTQPGAGAYAVENPVEEAAEPKDAAPLPKGPAVIPNPPPAPSFPAKEGGVKRGTPVVEVPFLLSPYEAMMAAEHSERNVLYYVGQVEKAHPDAYYMVMFFLPLTRSGPMYLPRDPNIYLNNVLSEMKELKIPSKRMRGVVEYKALMPRPRIIVYCFRCD